MSAQKVIVRCSKPCSQQEAWEIGNNAITLKLGGEEEERFEVDACSHGDSHAEFYSKFVSDWVTDVSSGHNITILAYGLPASGKTHCIMGTAGQSRVNPEARGIIVRCLDHLSESLHGGNKATRISSSFCHIFNDGRVADLLDTKKRSLQVIEVKQGVYGIKDCTQQILSTQQDVVRLIEKAHLMRNATGVVRLPLGEKQFTIKQPTTNPLQQYRPHSSHAVFQYTIEHINDTTGNLQDNQAIASLITIIDLAGHDIFNYHSDSTCQDVGLNALHDTMNNLASGNTQKASEICLSTSLTRLLYPSIFGNCRCLILSSMPMDSTNASVVKKSLQFSFSFKYCKNFSSPTQVSASVTALGKLLSELNELKTKIAHECNIDDVSSCEVVSDSSIMINGKVYDELNTSSIELLRKLVEIENSLFFNNNNPKSQAITVAKPPLQLSVPTTRPLQLHNPLSSLSPSDATKTLAPLQLQIPPVKVSTGTTKSPSNASKKLVNSSSDDSSSDSEPEEKPVVPSGMLPPPPLRDIPHILPSPTDKPPTPNEHPLSLFPPVSPVNPGKFPSIFSRPKSVPKRDSSKPQLSSLPNTKLPSSPINTEIQPVDYKNEQRSAVSLQENDEKQHKDTDILHEHHSDKENSSSMKDRKVSPREQEENKSSFKHQGSQSPLKNTEDQQNYPKDTGEKESSHIIRVKPLTSHDLIRPTSKSIPESSMKLNLKSSSSSSTDTSSGKRLSPKPQGERKKRRRRRSSLARDKSLSPARRSLNFNNNSNEQESATSLSKHTTVFTYHGLPSIQKNVHALSKSTTSESNSDEESRDTFDPNFQPGRLTMQPHMNYITQPVNVPQDISQSSGIVLDHMSYNYNQVPRVLPPINPQHHELPTYNHIKAVEHPVQSLPLYTPNYEAWSTFQRTQETREYKYSQYISDQEIHLAAMEGVKTSYLKKLVMKYGIDFRDKGGRTPLMYAVLGNQPRMCEVLLNMEAEVNAVDDSRHTALLWATFQARSEIIKILLKYGANIHECDPDERTVFHWAMKTPNVLCLKVLCKYAALGLENKADREGLTPLHWAVMCEQPQHIKILLSSLPSAKVNCQDAKGRTPLNYAVLNFSPVCVKAILDLRPTEIKHRDSKGRTALHYACAESSADCVRTILACKSCDIHVKDDRGTTPLHWAAAANQPGIVQLLLRRGADRGQTDNDNMTPLDYAILRNHSECVQILKSYGLQRPTSAWSVASQFSIHPPTPPELDEHGHVPMKRPTQHFSLSGGSFSSFDRPPADGHSQTDDTERTPPSPTQEEINSQPQNENQTQNECQSQERRLSTLDEIPQDSNHLLQHQPHSSNPSRLNQFFQFFVSCVHSNNNTVVPE